MDSWVKRQHQETAKGSYFQTQQWHLVKEGLYALFCVFSVFWGIMMIIFWEKIFYSLNISTKLCFLNMPLYCIKNYISWPMD